MGGGEEKIRPMLDYAYSRYSTDPLTTYTFQKGVAQNTCDPDHIKNAVITFFSAGIGGPFKYEGKDMTAAHADMGIDEVAYHALNACFLEAMEKFGTGDRKEWNEVLGILLSLKEPVMGTTNSVKYTPGEGSL